MEIKVFAVGLQHHNDALVFDCGMPVSVVYDDHNEHSDNAFCVYTEGGLMGGYLAESEFYWRKLAFRENAILSTDLKELIDRGYTITGAVVDEIRGRQFKSTKVFIKLTLEKEETASEEVVEEMEELDMDMGEITVVGVSHYSGNASEGDLVHFTVKKGKTELMTTDNVSIGCLPQGERKINELNAIGAPIVKNRDKREDVEFLSKPYIVVNVVEGKYVFVREMNEEDLVQATNNDPEVVVEEETVDEVSVEAETEAEPANEEMEESEMNNIEKELDELNSSIRALKAQKEAIEAEMEAKMARREELAAINAKRIALIEKLQKELETLDLSVLEAINNVVSSSTPEEDTSSSIEEETVPEVVQKVHEGKELSFDEWKKYVEYYWKHGFDILRKEEENLGFNDFKAIDRFVNKIKRFNKQLKEFKNEGYDEILTLYWIKNVEMLKTVCNAYELTSHRLTNSCIMDDNDLSFFLEG